MRKQFKVFLASSSELEEERKAIIKNMESYISCVVEFELIIWEDMCKSYKANGIQRDEINAKLEDCEIVIFLFKSKIGKYTNEELNISLNNIKDTKKIKYLYFFMQMYIAKIIILILKISTVQRII